MMELRKSRTTMAFIRTVCTVGIILLAFFGGRGGFGDVGVDPVPRAVVSEIMPLEEVEARCAELLGLGDTCAVGFVMGCQVEVWVGDTLTTYIVQGSPFIVSTPDALKEPKSEEPKDDGPENHEDLEKRTEEGEMAL